MKQHPFKRGVRVHVEEKWAHGHRTFVDAVRAVYENGNFVLEGVEARQFKAYELPQGKRSLWRAHATGAPNGCVYTIRLADDAMTKNEAVPAFTAAVDALRHTPLDRVTPEAVAALQTAIKALAPVQARP